MKRDRTRERGATVVLYDRYRESRDAIGARIAAEQGATLIPPYDHPLVMAGQGTVGLEMAQQAAGQGIRLDAAYIPCSGGGLIAGCAMALKQAFPVIGIHGAEPEGHDDTRRSIAAGRIVANENAPASICDGLLAAQPGALTFPINRRLLAAVHVVGEAAIRQAMRLAFDHLKLVLEPSGAIALAAALEMQSTAKADAIGVVLSGGNIDASAWQRLMAG